MEALFLCSACFWLVTRQTYESQREAYQGHMGKSIGVKEGGL